LHGSNLALPGAHLAPRADCATRKHQRWARPRAACAQLAPAADCATIPAAGCRCALRVSRSDCCHGLESQGWRLFLSIPWLQASAIACPFNPDCHVILYDDALRRQVALPDASKPTTESLAGISASCRRILGVGTTEQEDKGAECVPCDGQCPAQLVQPRTVRRFPVTGYRCAFFVCRSDCCPGLES
jgi:hypothetical protein